MYSEKLLITENYKEIEQAKSLGMPEPEEKQNTTKILFWKSDVKRAVINDDKIMVSFQDDDAYAFEYDAVMWEELKEYFIDNEQ